MQKQIILYHTYPNYFNGEIYRRRVFDSIEQAQRWFRKYVKAYNDFHVYDDIVGDTVIYCNTILNNVSPIRYRA